MEGMNVREYDSVKVLRRKVQFFGNNIRIVFTVVSEVALFSLMGKKWNRMLNSFERGASARLWLGGSRFLVVGVQFDKEHVEYSCC